MSATQSLPYFEIICSLDIQIDQRGEYGHHMLVDKILKIQKKIPGLNDVSIENFKLFFSCSTRANDFPIFGSS